MPEETPGSNGANGSGDLQAAYGGAVPTPTSEMRALEAEFRALESSILLARLQFARQAGITFDGLRDEYAVFGYPRLISYKDYRDEYARGGIAGRVVDVMPDATWRGDPPFELVEDDDPDHDTEFEKAWKLLSTKHQIPAKLQRVDRLARLSTYAVLLIGAPGELEGELPRGTPQQLLYLTPFSGGGGPGMSRNAQTLADFADCSVFEYEADAKNPRFGLPKSYQLKRTDFVSLELQRPVHWSRIVHVAEGLLDDDVFGQPALERVWNLLIDLRKVTGGGAEAFWLRANQGMHLDVDKDMALADAKNTLDALKAQAEDYKHQMTRWLRTRGVKVDTLGSDVANFANPADAIITQIAGARGIPKRILTGSEMGELASSQDRENFKDLVNGRQLQYAGPYIVRQLVDRLIAYNYLPTPTKYEVHWPHIQTLTEDEKAEGAKSWAETVVAGEPVFVDSEIRDKWYGMAPLTDEQRQELADRKAEAVAQAQEAMGATQPDDDEEERPRFPRAAQVGDEELIRVLAAAIEAGHQEVVNRIIGLQDGPHKYGTTQVQLPADLAERLLALGRAIPDDDLYEPEGGRETDAHITAFYGLVGEVAADKLRAVANRRRSGHVTFGKTSFFATPDYDVVYVVVKSPDLDNLNKALASGLPAKPSDHAEYVPHATVAYVKAGLGEKYAGSDALDGATFKFDTVVMVSKDEDRQEIRLA